MIKKLKKKTSFFESPIQRTDKNLDELLLSTEEKNKLHYLNEKSMQATLIVSALKPTMKESSPS